MLGGFASYLVSWWTLVGIILIVLAVVSFPRVLALLTFNPNIWMVPFFMIVLGLTFIFGFSFIRYLWGFNEGKAVIIGIPVVALVYFVTYRTPKKVSKK